MFEKESKEYAIGLTYPKFQDNQIANIVLRDVEGGFQKGAEFGYNKANEWHFVKDGDLPKETNEYYVYSKQWGIEVRKFFADIGYFECRKNIIIAWKEIVFPELPKESE